MKVEVTEPFIDKYTRAVYKKGDIIDVTAARFAEIESVKKTLIRKVAKTKKNNGAE